MTQVLPVRHLAIINRRGFSLIEMMVAIALATILMLMLVKFVETATTAIVYGEDRLCSTNDAQAAMDLVVTDIASVKAVQSPVAIAGNLGNSVEVLQGFGNGSTANPGITLTSQGTTNPATTSIYPMDLYLLATPPAGYNTGGTSITGAGTAHLIRYKLVWQDPVQGSAGDNPVMALYRDNVSSSATFGFGATTTGETNNTVGIGGLHDLYGNYWSSTGTPPASDLLVSNIFDFQILLYDIGGTTPTIPINQPTVTSTNNYYYQSSIANSGQTFHLSSQGLFINAAKPAVQPTAYSQLVAEIRMTIINQHGVSILNTGAPKLDSVSAKYAHVYMRRVPISL